MLLEGMKGGNRPSGALNEFVFVRRMAAFSAKAAAGPRRAPKGLGAVATQREGPKGADVKFRGVFIFSAGGENCAVTE